jgi:hypothetical protein
VGLYLTSLQTPLWLMEIYRNLHVNWCVDSCFLSVIFIIEFKIFCHTVKYSLFVKFPVNIRSVYVSSICKVSICDMCTSIRKTVTPLKETWCFLPELLAYTYIAWPSLVSLNSVAHFANY